MCGEVFGLKDFPSITCTNYEFIGRLNSTSFSFFYSPEFTESAGDVPSFGFVAEASFPLVSDINPSGYLSIFL